MSFQEAPFSETDNSITEQSSQPQEERQPWLPRGWSATDTVSGHLRDDKNLEML